MTITESLRPIHFSFLSSRARQALLNFPNTSESDRRVLGKTEALLSKALRGVEVVRTIQFGPNAAEEAEAYGLTLGVLAALGDEEDKRTPRVRLEDLRDTLQQLSQEQEQVRPEQIKPLDEFLYGLEQVVRERDTVPFDICSIRR